MHQCSALGHGCGVGGMMRHQLRGVLDCRFDGVCWYMALLKMTFLSLYSHHQVSGSLLVEKIHVNSA